MSDTVGVDLDRALRVSEMAPCRTLSTQRWVGKTAGTHLASRLRNGDRQNFVDVAREM